MKTTRHTLAALSLLLALPATAGDADFLREMARTDGNPFGDYAIPEASFGSYTAIDEAFLVELTRGDGNAVVTASRAETLDKTASR
jgi:hypothetical protein